MLYFILAVLFMSLAFLWFQSKDGKKLPPGPPALPIIGHLHILGTLPHQKLANLAKKYGPLMSIRLGLLQGVVVSSPEIARLVLKTHDNICANRSKTQFSIYMYYETKGLAFVQYGAYWRNIRKLCTLHLLSGSKVESFAPIRRKHVVDLVMLLKKYATASEKVDLTCILRNALEKITYKMVFGRCSASENYSNMSSILLDGWKLLNAFNLAEFVPFLRPFDLQGLKRRMKNFSKSIDKLLEKIIEEHEKDDKIERKQDMDFVDILLSFMKQPQNEYKLDQDDIKAILIDMIAASDTALSTILWTFSELLRNPRVMKHLQEEIQTLIGTKRMVDETDLINLPYLDMVIKENLRLHPTGPLLARETMDDITINGYYIPKETQITVNVWALGRDSTIWSSNVLDFSPERFADSNIDLKGHDFELLPFGSGRRGCPGIHLGLTTIRLVVAQLVHCFNWELPDAMLPGDLDMTELNGITVRLANNLVVFPTTYRLLC